MRIQRRLLREHLPVLHMLLKAYAIPHSVIVIKTNVYHEFWYVKSKEFWYIKRKVSSKDIQRPYTAFNDTVLLTVHARTLKVMCNTLLPTYLTVAQLVAKTFFP